MSRLKAAKPGTRAIQTLAIAALIVTAASGQIYGAETQAAQGRNVKTLVRQFESGDVNVMVAAADSLRQLGPGAAAAAPALAGQLDHPLGWVRTAAMDALTAIGRGAVPALLEVFEKGPAGGRTRASLVLGAIGPEARAAIPALKAALEKAPETQRDGLRQVIDQIEQGGAATAPDSSLIPVSQAFVANASTQRATSNEREWGQFHGPRRDAASRETGLLKTWPAGGPKLAWTMKGLGRGFSSVAIADGKLLTMGDRPAEGGDAQFVIAYDLAARKELWAARVGKPHLKEGPRCTPTIDGARVFALGTDGDLVCLDTATGKDVWRKSMSKDFGGKVMTEGGGWKWCESPLVDSDKVICTPGAPDAALVALKKETGEVVWKCAVGEIGPKGKDGAGYSSVVVAEIGGVRQYVQMLGRGVVGVEAASGRLLWSYNPIASTTANITHPLVLGDFIFTANGYNTGSALLKIRRGEGGNWKADAVYTLRAKQFSNHHGGIVAAGGYIYGGIGDNSGMPVCIQAVTGKVAWQGKAPVSGSASVFYADGNLIFRYDRGLVVLVEATPKEFKIKGSFKPQLGEGPAWAHMVVLDGKLYLRHGDLLMCYEVK